MRTAAILLALVAAPVLAAPSATPEERLAELTRGRTAGDPVACINRQDVRRMKIVDETAIVYEMRDRNVYVNRAGGSCTSLRSFRAVQSQTPSPRLCSGDIVRVIDPPTPMEFGSCPLTDFVPYRQAG